MTRQVELMAFCAAAVLAAASPSLAADAVTTGQTTVQELVVTAERRGAEELQNVPMGVDAYSGSSLDQYNVQSLQDLNKIDPSLAIQQFGAGQETVIIRGVSSTTGTTTGVYLDEAPLLGGFNGNIFGDNAPVLALHDLDHVEVLKGPQGTLFGTGSMDGTLRVITNKPDLADYHGMIEGRVADVTSGGDGYFDGNAMLNIPIIKDHFGVRLVGWGADGGGYINQYILNGDGSTTFLQHTNDLHQYGGRLEALWKPNDRFSVLATINAQNTHSPGAQSWTPLVGPLFAAGGTNEGPYPAYQNHSPSQEPYRDRYILDTLTATYDLGVGSLVFTTSYGTKNQLQMLDGTPSDCSFTLCYPAPGYPGVFSAWSQFYDWTDELRFSSNFKGPFQLVAGVYYEDDNLLYNEAELHADAGSGVSPCDTFQDCVAKGLVVPGFGVSPVEFAEQDTFRVRQYAVYGQANYNIIPSVTVTLGVRYFSANLSDLMLTQQNIAPAETPSGFDGGWVLGDITTPYYSEQSTAHESKTTFNGSLLWHINPDVSAYARAASGFRIGGVNESAEIASEEGIAVPATFGPDTLWDYEVGLKAYLFDRRLFVDLDYYHIDWSGEQEEALANGVFFYTLNVGETKVNGIEFSSTFHPTQNWTMSGNITWVDATLAQNLPANVVAGGTPGMTGDTQPYVPKLSITGQAQYEHPINNALRGYIQGDFTYRSTSSSAFEPTAAGAPSNFYTQLPAYFLMDLKAGVRFRGFDVGVYLNNVTNNAAYLGAHATIDAVRIYTPPPRTVGLDVSARF